MHYRVKRIEIHTRYSRLVAVRTDIRPRRTELYVVEDGLEMFVGYLDTPGILPSRAVARIESRLALVAWGGSRKLDPADALELAREMLPVQGQRLLEMSR